MLNQTIRITGLIVLSIVILAAAFHVKPYLYVAPAEADNGPLMAEKASMAKHKNDSPVLLELFTSQGCYSCPPAEALLRELSVRPDVIALEYHVDYWDDLVYGIAGKWKDPYSKPQFTARQSHYNLKIRNREQVYTPQIVINGQRETVGTRKSEILRVVKNTPPSALKLKPVVNDTKLRVSIDGDIPKDTSIVYVRYIKRVKTSVKSGENKGKNLASYNVVTSMGFVGSRKDENGGVQRSIAALEPHEHCAVFAQNRDTLQIYSAAVCETAAQL